MSAIIITLIITASLYVGYAYGQEVLDEVNNALERVRAVASCISECFKRRS